MCDDIQIDERLASIERNLAHIRVFVDELGDLLTALRADPPPVVKMLMPALARKPGQ